MTLSDTVCQHLDFGLFSFQNYDKQISICHLKAIQFMAFCYSCLYRLTQGPLKKKFSHLKTTLKYSFSSPISAPSWTMDIKPTQYFPFFSPQRSLNGSTASSFHIFALRFLFPGISIFTFESQIQLPKSVSCSAVVLTRLLMPLLPTHCRFHGVGQINSQCFSEEWNNSRYFKWREFSSEAVDVMDPTMRLKVTGM